MTVTARSCFSMTMAGMARGGPYAADDPEQRDWKLLAGLDVGRVLGFAEQVTRGEAIATGDGDVAQLRASPVLSLLVGAGERHQIRC